MKNNCCSSMNFTTVNNKEYNLKLCVFKRGMHLSSLVISVSQTFIYPADDRNTAGPFTLCAVWLYLGNNFYFWVVAPCSLVEVYQRFRGPCCLHHQGDDHHYTALQPRRQPSSYSPPWEPQIQLLLVRWIY
jgi:hypothetical protein